MSFSGSYVSDDVAFLLKPVRMLPIPVAEKERLIQGGQRHYSEMIGEERPPDREYLTLFYEAFERNRQRLARDIGRLARALADRSGEVTIVSLARAGTPIGVLLRRTLHRLGRPGAHYSISIVRDRGIDAVALDYVLARHDPASVVFVDGWTGKGAIASELDGSVRAFNASRGTCLDSGLAAVADLCGAARLAATTDDYLIPSAILNAVVSGLVSRTVLNADAVRDGDFHACVYYRELEPYDVTRWFVDSLERDVVATLDGLEPATELSVVTRAQLAKASHELLSRVMASYAVTDPNRFKPGIGEATRALLRRVPERLIVRSRDDEDVQHLMLLAQRSRVPVAVDHALPYRAAALIRTLGRD